MDIHNRQLSAFLAQISMGCILYAILSMLLLGKTADPLRAPVILLVYAPLIYLLNVLLMRRSRTLRSLILFGGAAFLLLEAILFMCDGWQGQFFALVVAGCGLLLTVQGGMYCLEAPKLSQLILQLDLSLVLLVGVTAFASAHHMDLLSVLPTAVGCACAMLSTACGRLGSRLQGGGWAMLGASFLLVLGVLWLLVRFAAAPAGGGVVALWYLLVAALKLVGQLFRWLLMLLATLFPPPDAAPSDLEPPLSFEPPAGMEPMMELPQAILIAMAAAVAAAMGVCLFFLLRLLGRFRLQRKTGTIRRSAVRQRTSLRQGIRRLLREWRSALRVRLWLFRNRNTAAGLFFWIQRLFRSGPWQRQAGETPHGYLTRIAQLSAADERLSRRLTDLLPAVDASFYGAAGSKADRIPSVGVIRRGLRRQRLRQWGMKIRLIAVRK